MTPGSWWLVGVVDKDAEPRERGSALVGTVTGVARGVMYRIAVGALFKRTCAGLCTLCPDDFGVSREWPRGTSRGSSRDTDFVPAAGFTIGSEFPVLLSRSYWAFQNLTNVSWSERKDWFYYHS